MLWRSKLLVLIRRRLSAGWWQSTGLKLKQLSDELCLCVHMAHYYRNAHRHATDNNSVRKELQHIGTVCCNLHCRSVAVADGNKLVAVPEWQSMEMQMVFFRPVARCVHSLQRHDCDQHARRMLSVQLEIPKPQALTLLLAMLTASHVDNGSLLADTKIAVVDYRMELYESAVDLRKMRLLADGRSWRRLQQEMREAPD